MTQNGHSDSMQPLGTAAVSIFHSETGSHEEWLHVNHDGTVTHHVETAGWAMRGGLYPKEKTMSADDAKRQWPSYAPKIDEALAAVAVRKT